MVHALSMNNTVLGSLLKEKLPSLHGRPGMWQATVDSLTLYVITDETHDRMRIMSPVTEAALDNALEQVITLARTTGSSYTSSDLFFGSA